MKGQRRSTFNIYNAQLKAFVYFVCLITPKNYLALLIAISFDQCNMSK